MPLLDFESHQRFIESHAGRSLNLSILKSYYPVRVNLGDTTKDVGNQVGAFWDFRPWMYRIDPQLAARWEELFSKQGTLFVSNLRYPRRRGGTGRNANITFDYRCLVCSGHVDGYTSPPPYDEVEPCHDVMKSLNGSKEFAEVTAFRRNSDKMLVIRKDWSWETLGNEKEVQAIYSFDL